MEAKTTARPLQNNIYQRNFKTPLREGFTSEERKELQYAVSITDYLREKNIMRLSEKCF